METSVAHRTITIHEDQPARPVEADHPAQLTETSPTSTSRTPRHWLAVGMIVVAAAVGIAVTARTSDDRRLVDPGVVAERDDLGTELDVHGIPTWWSGRAPAP